MSQTRSKKKSDSIAANFISFMPKSVEPKKTNLVAFFQLNRNYSFIKSKTDPLKFKCYNT